MPGFDVVDLHYDDVDDDNNDDDNDDGISCLPF